MTTKQVRAAVLAELYAIYRSSGGNLGLELKELKEQVPAPPAVIEKVVEALEKEGLVEDDGVICLTTYGAEAIEEDPKERLALQFVQNNDFGGAQLQNVQLGSHNSQTITCQTVLLGLAEAIERDPNIPDDKKREWRASLIDVAESPLAQTLVSAAATIAAGLVGK